MITQEYHDYLIRQNDGAGDCSIFNKANRLVGEERSVALAKKLIDGKIEGRVPADWQSGGVATAWDVPLRGGSSSAISGSPSAPFQKSTQEGVETCRP